MVDYLDLKGVHILGVWRTALEHQILEMLADGFTDKAIGEYLEMTTRHVQTKIPNLRKKLNRQTRKEMIRWYRTGETAVGVG